MPMPSYMKVVGTTQGEIQGSCQIQGHQNTILVQGVDHQIEIPRSPQTGLPTGKRVHLPMTITKEIDKSSPKLYQALCSGEKLSSVELDYYRVSAQGKEEKYYTVKLEDAIVVGMRGWVPNCLLPVDTHYGHMEDVSFTYSKIIETWQPDGIEAEDSWLAPKA